MLVALAGYCNPATWEHLKCSNGLICWVMPCPCSSGTTHKVRWASVKEGMKENPDARKKIGRSPVLHPGSVRLPQTLGRDLHYLMPFDNHQITK